MAPKPIVPEALLHGPFTLAEARRAGLQRWHLEGASWLRLTRGIYFRAGASDNTIFRLTAVSRRFPHAAAFSGMTAAWLHGLDVGPCDPIEITGPPNVGVSRPAGMRVRRALLPECEVVRLHRLRATSIVRTIADLSARLNLVEAVVIADAALHARKVKTEALVGWAKGRRRGVRCLRRVITFAEPAAESPMESRLRMVLLLSGLPRPRAQVEIRDREGRFVGRPDLYYEQAMLGIEYDGSEHRDSLAADNHRQNNLLGAGVRLLRFTYTDVMQYPAQVVAQVRAMLWSNMRVSAAPDHRNFDHLQGGSALPLR